MKCRKGEYELEESGCEKEATVKSLYIQTRIADETDDVDTSLSSLSDRTRILNDITEHVPKTKIRQWDKTVNKSLTKIKTYSSGRPYP